MIPLCESCVEARPVVYCKCDSARLCFKCDTDAHAHRLLRRHHRWLICDKCLSQPAIVHCMDDKMSVCQGCDCNRNVCQELGHKLVKLKSYTDCPSLAEIWSFAFDSISGGLGLADSWGSFNSLPKSQSQCLVQLDDNDASFADKSSELELCAKYEPEMTQSSILKKNPHFMAYCRDQPVLLPEGSNLQPKGCYDAKDIGISEANDLFEGLNMDGVQLNLDGINEIFDYSQDAAGYQVEDGGLDCLLMEKNISVTEPNGLFQNAMEASSSIVQQGCVAFQSSREVGSGSMIQGNTNCVLMDTSCNAKMNLGFLPQGQVHSNTPPREPNLKSSSPQAREKAKVRYFEKKKNRTFGKQIRYASRKARADTRKRIKGRFVKAEEEYDSD
ncbi:hypothetical protein K1719_042716 [Acacia pycnantha]|nr:hypothetical protein K1719_042716 [Acacia pycnantha]